MRHRNPYRVPCACEQGTNFLLKVSGIMVADPTAEQLSVHRGQLVPDSAYIFETRHGSGVKVTGQRSVMATQLFKHKEFNFEMLGIGGLDDQFEQIFRRAFASRVFPPSVVERLGIRHVRGVLLYGPPGVEGNGAWLQDGADGCLPALQRPYGLGSAWGTQHALPEEHAAHCKLGIRVSAGSFTALSGCCVAAAQAPARR